MATQGGVSLMIMYEDESVDVHYGDSSRLHLSACGSEFLLERPRAPGSQPLRAAQRTRQRTRFAISNYKGLLQSALEFRNKYAERPYLPGELIPADLLQRLFSVDRGAVWPALGSCGAELGPSGETVVGSAEGRACLLLSSSGEEFSVQFTCSLSRDQDQNRSVPVRDPGAEGSGSGGQNRQPRSQTSPLSTSAGETRPADARGTTRKVPDRARSCSPRCDVRHYQPESTRVVQHHSCSRVPEAWSYPLSLARQHRALAQQGAAPDPGGGGGGGGGGESGGDPCPGERGRNSALPEALPLTCASPHLHRWQLKDSLPPGEQAPPTELVRVVWCQGVIYRLVGGAIPVIEVSPGDGSVLRSNGALDAYFTHHAAGATPTAEVKQVTYHLSALPPDSPGQIYSVASVVTRASRILSCYNQARRSLKLHASLSCLSQEDSFSESMSFEQKVHRVSESVDSRTPETAQSGLVAAELEKIKRFTFLLENSSLPSIQRASPGPTHPRVTGGPTEPQAPEGPLITQASIAEALQRTSRAIQDIDTLLSA